MYTLYNFPGAGGLAAEAVMTDAKIAFRSVVVKPEEGNRDTSWFNRINPRGQVPALVLPDDSVITESAAILLYLAEAHPDAGLMPPPGSSAGGQVLRWLLFFAVNIYEGELRRHYSQRYSSDPSGAEAVKQAAATHVAQNYELFEESLGEGPYFLGERISVLDYYVWMLSHWVGDRSWILEKCPKVARLTDAVRNRPAVAPLHEAQLT